MLRPLANWDLLVVGGGIVGASAAYHAARAGARVLVVDRDDPGRATSAGAGIVSPETDLHHTEAYFELGRRAAEYYPTLLDGLPRRAGYQRCGMLVVAADETEERAFDAFAPRALERQRERQEIAPADAMREIAARPKPALSFRRSRRCGARCGIRAARASTVARSRARCSTPRSRAACSDWRGSVERILFEPSGDSGDAAATRAPAKDHRRHRRRRAPRRAAGDRGRRRLVAGAGVAARPARAGRAAARDRSRTWSCRAPTADRGRW